MREGLVRSIGVSNFSARKLQALMDSAAIPPAVCQVWVIMRGAFELVCFPLPAVAHKAFHTSTSLQG